MSETLRQLYDGRRLEEAWAEYLHLGPSPDARVHWYGGLTARLRGDLPAARRCLERAAERQPTGTLLGQIRLMYGVVLREIGDVRLAIQTFQEYLDQLPDYEELRPVTEAPAYYWLGLAYRQARDYPGAIVYYRTAIDLARQHDLREHLRMALQNLAWVLCLVDDPCGAGDALDEAEPLCMTEEARWQQRIGRAFVAVASGAEREAVDLCEAIAQGPATVPADVRSHAYWLAGRTALRLGLMAEARGLAQQALNHALLAKGENRCLYDASDLLREVRTRSPTIGA